MDPVLHADDSDDVTADLLRQTVEEMRQERDALRARLDEARARIRELEGRLHWAEAALARTEAERQELEADLAVLRSGLGRAVLQRFRQAKARLLQPGSAVERVHARLNHAVARRLGDRGDGSPSRN